MIREWLRVGMYWVVQCKSLRPKDFFGPQDLFPLSFALTKSLGHCGCKIHYTPPLGSVRIQALINLSLKFICWEVWGGKGKYFHFPNTKACKSRLSKTQNTWNRNNTPTNTSHTKCEQIIWYLSDAIAGVILVRVTWNVIHIASQHHSCYQNIYQMW